MHDPSKKTDPNLSILMKKTYLPAVFFCWDVHSPDCFLLIPMDSPKCSWVLCSVHILTVLSPIQHPTFFPLGRSALSHRIRYFLPLPFFTRSLIVYLTLLPLTRLFLNRTLVPSLCSICTSLLPVVRSPFTFSCQICVVSPRVLQLRSVFVPVKLA